MALERLDLEDSVDDLHVDLADVAVDREGLPLDAKHEGPLLLPAVSPGSEGLEYADPITPAWERNLIASSWPVTP